MNEMPVFVRVEDYKEVLDVVELLKDKIQQARKMLEKIAELQREEESLLEQWKAGLNQIDDRVHAIDAALLEPQGL